MNWFWLAPLAFATAGLAADEVARPRVLVLPPTSTVVDAATAGSIANLILVEVSRERRLDVISADDVKRLAELEGEKQALGCTRTDCLAELAGALGARYVIFGDVGPLGAQKILNLNLFDSQTASAVNRTTTRFTAVEELPDVLPGVVGQLIAPLAATTKPTAAGPPTPPPPPPAPAATTSGGTSPLLTWGLVGSGAVVFVVGGAYDAAAPSSGDEKVNGLDFIGPFVMVVGAGLAATGAALLLFSGGSDV